MFSTKVQKQINSRSKMSAGNNSELRLSSSEKRSSEDMARVLHQTKQLYLTVRENEDKYTNDEICLKESLEKTDELYTSLYSNKPTADEFLQDTDLFMLQSKIVRQNTKAYKIHTLTFNPRMFSQKIRNHFGLGNYDENINQSKSLSTLWGKLGECSREIMCTVPTFNFLYGTFDADPVAPAKKMRKSYRKDKLGELVQTKLVSIDSVNATQDVMCKDAERLLSFFIRYLQKKEKRSLCFYEFVIDPTSFTRTVENVFLVSLLVQHGSLCLFEDEDGLPFLKLVESKHSEEWSKTAKQSALCLSMDEYQKLIRTFGFKKPVIPPRKHEDHE